MASSSGGPGGHGGRPGSSGSRFDILQNYNDNFPEAIGDKPDKIKRRRPEVNTYTSASFFSKNQKLSDLLEGPKYIIMKRNESNKELTLSSVSPFLVMKVIENIAGKPKTTKLLRDGSLLIHTTSQKQADKLYNLKQLTNNINITVFEHSSLNLSKGTIFCKDILVASDDEIKEALRDQHVIDIHRMKKKNRENMIVDSGLFIITFNLCQLPTHINAGYERIEVREYFPNPRRCFNCQRFGHGAKFCNKQPGVCGKCSDYQHTPDECVQPMCCPNCKLQHPAWDRKCPVFLQEMNIQKIQTTNRISNYEARKRYHDTNPKIQNVQNMSFANATALLLPSNDSRLSPTLPKNTQYQSNTSTSVSASKTKSLKALNKVNSHTNKITDHSQSVSSKSNTQSNKNNFTENDTQQNTHKETDTTAHQMQDISIETSTNTNSSSNLSIQYSTNINSNSNNDQCAIIPNAHTGASELKLQYHTPIDLDDG